MEIAHYALQIGQSGAVVKPVLYIGFGISGAVNHVTGVTTDMFIAVNKRADAQIFNYCDYGIVGDMDEACDAMIACSGAVFEQGKFIRKNRFPIVALYTQVPGH